MTKKSQAVLVNVACLLGVILIGVARPDTNLWVSVISALVAFLVVNLAVFRWAPAARKKNARSDASVILTILSLVLLATALLIEWQLRKGK